MIQGPFHGLPSSCGFRSNELYLYPQSYLGSLTHFVLLCRKKEANLAKLSNEQLRELARHGAAARIAELEAEIASIRSEFRIGGARRGRKQGRGPGRPRKTDAQPAAGASRKRRGMGPEARKAHSERMKKLWAERRAARSATEKPKVRAGKKK